MSPDLIAPGARVRLRESARNLFVPSGDGVVAKSVIVHSAWVNVFFEGHGDPYRLRKADLVGVGETTL